MRAPHRCLAAAWLTVAAIGCETAIETVEVVGKVSYRGTPLDHGMVSFLPADGKPIGAAVSNNGTYEARLPPGDYRVAVVAPPKLPEGYREGDELPPSDPDALPAKYAHPDRSGLSATATLQDGPQTLDFDLK